MAAASDDLKKKLKAAKKKRTKKRIYTCGYGGRTAAAPASTRKHRVV